MLLSLFTRIAQAIPLRAGYRLADAASSVHRRLSPGRRKAVETNLRVVASDRDPSPLVAGVFRNYGRYLFEFLRGPDVPEVRVQWDGRAILDEALERKRGVVLAVVHTGNWEIAGSRLAREGIRMSAVADVQLRRAWTRELRRRQERSGIRILAPGSGAYRSMKGLLAANEVIALLVDGDVFRGGHSVELCGREVTFPKGPAKLAARHGAALVPAFCVRHPDGSLAVKFLAEIPVESTRPDDLREATALLAGRIGEVLHGHPDQWLIFRRFFGEPAARADQEAA